MRIRDKHGHVEPQGNPSESELHRRHAMRLLRRVAEALGKDMSEFSVPRVPVAPTDER